MSSTPLLTPFLSHDEEGPVNPFLFSVGSTTCKLDSFEWIKRVGEGAGNEESNDNKRKKQEKDGKVYDDDSMVLMMSRILLKGL